MKQLSLLLLLTAVLVSTSFSQSPATVASKEDAIRIAKDYLQRTSPGLDISQKPPTADFSPDIPAHGGAVWTVGFIVPAPKDPATGKTAGVHPFVGLVVWVHPDGTADGAPGHTP